MTDKRATTASKANDDLLNPIGLPAHIRVKRHKLCLFIHTDLRVDTVLVIKERLERLTGVPVMKQRLYYGKQLLHNTATLWDSGIEFEDSELALVFCVGTGPGDVDLWEDRVEALEGPPPAAAGSVISSSHPGTAPSSQQQQQHQSSAAGEGFSTGIGSDL